MAQGSEGPDSPTVAWWWTSSPPRPPTAATASGSRGPGTAHGSTSSGSGGTGWLALVTAERLASYGAVGIPVVNPATSEHQELLTAPILSGAVR